MEDKRFLADMMRYEKMSHHERLAFAQGYTVLAGIDEAGRGPLAGPVVAATCILNPDRPVYGLNDSKKLTPAKRNRLYQTLLEDAKDYAVARVEAAEIDQINILQATCRAMEKAVAGLKMQPDLLLIDAVNLDYQSVPGWSIVKGDGLSVSIAAASILAKVSRDQLMDEYDLIYPGYGFSQHKGYGTPMHYQALLKLGPCPIHRRTFLRSFAEKLIISGHVDKSYFGDE